MEENYKAGLAMPPRSSLFADYLDAIGAKTKSYTVIVNPNGTIYHEEPLTDIPTKVYARQTSPRRKSNREGLETMTITYQWFAGVGALPIATSTLDKENHRTQITVFSISFNPQAPGYNETSANALMGQLYTLEKRSCMDMVAQLVYQKAVIFEYDINFNGDSIDIPSINTVSAEPYIELIFSSRNYDDADSVTIVWENTEAGWLPVISSIDGTINHGFLITIPKSQARIYKRDSTTDNKNTNQNINTTNGVTQYGQ